MLRHRVVLRLFAVCALATLALSACVNPQSRSEDVPNPVVEEVVQAFPDQVMTSGDLSGLYKNAGEGTPVILIIPGSGPTDLNGNNPMGVESNVYQYLAEGLAAQAVSTVRVDKRGMFSSEAAGNPNQVTVDLYAQDYSGWVETVRAATGADCVFILGHSEGALMASATANINENICGQILVAGVGRSFGDVMREQLTAQPGGKLLMKKALANIDKLESGEKIPDEDLDLISKQIFPSHVQDFVISLMKTNPAELAKSADVPTLVLHGETDIQTSVEDARALAEATGGDLVLLPGVNHILKDAPKSRLKNIKTYSQPELPLSDGVVDAIAEFVEA